MGKNTVTRKKEEIADDLKKVIQLQKDISQEKISLYAELKKLSEDSENPLTIDNGKVIERTGLFSLKKIKGVIKPIKKKEGLSFMDKYNLNNHPTITYFIEMFFSNGTVKEWILKSKDEVFAYKKRLYYLRHNDVWYHVTRNQHKLYFHEDFTCPIDRKIIQIGDKNFFSVTPMNIKPLLAMEYVKALVSGDEMNKWVKFCLIAIIVNILITIISFIVKQKQAAG